MQEFWFCEACRSMNRGDADYCYRCRAPKVQATMATVHERTLDGVMLPGVDYLEQNEAVAILARHPYSAAWPMGYLSAVLLLVPVIFQLGLIVEFAFTTLRLAVPALYDSTLMPPAMYQGVWLVFLGSTLLAGAAHSVFLGFVTSNVPSLAAGQPRFGPLRAAAWWIEALGWTLRADLSIWIPLYVTLWIMGRMAWLGFEATGALVFGLGLLWLVHKIFGGPVDAVRKPGRLLDDLTKRLGLSSTPSGRAGLWTGAWGIARLIDATFPLVIIGSAFLVVILAVAQLSDMAAGGSGLFDFWNVINGMGVVVGSMMVVELAANAIALCLLIRITLSLCEGERARRKWVLAAARTPGGMRPAPQPAPPPPPQPRPAPVAPAPPMPQAPPAIAPAAVMPAPQANAPAIPLPRWIRTQADSRTGQQDVDLGPEDEPLADDDVNVADAPRKVLSPSLRVVPVYALPGSTETRAPAPAAAIKATEPAPVLEATEPALPPGQSQSRADDWPEGI
jgi:hypothetical protein